MAVIRIALTVSFVATVAVYAIKSSLIEAFAIRNESMLPYLKPNSTIAILKTSPCIKLPFSEKRFACSPCEIGHAYVFQNPELPQERLVKFATRALHNACFFEGSNTQYSIDSRRFGAVPLTKIEGKVVYPPKP